jgi:hypothetical protein
MHDHEKVAVAILAVAASISFGSYWVFARSAEVGFRCPVTFGHTNVTWHLSVDPSTNRYTLRQGTAILRRNATVQRLNYIGNGQFAGLQFNLMQPMRMYYYLTLDAKTSDLYIESLSKAFHDKIGHCYDDSSQGL